MRWQEVGEEMGADGVLARGAAASALSPKDSTRADVLISSQNSAAQKIRAQQISFPRGESSVSKIILPRLQRPALVINEEAIESDD